AVAVPTVRELRLELVPRRVAIGALAPALVDLAGPEERVGEVVAVGELHGVALERGQRVVVALGQVISPAEGPEVLAFVADVAGVDGTLQVEQRDVVIDLVGAVVLRAQQLRLAALHAIEPGEKLLGTSRPP